jgi:uncharacterized 2Fe-2S/4Fe-4S cluster protein (DUF4445 family)
MSYLNDSRAALESSAKILYDEPAGITDAYVINLSLNLDLRGCVFVPAFFSAPGLRCAELGIPAHPDAEILLAPAAGSYVGGDIAAGVFAAGFAEKKTTAELHGGNTGTLFIDLGTNGEIVFGNGDFLMACACSAGPAFEGGDISCGMRAMAGAIEACLIDAETMTPHLSVIGGGKPLGICGSGLIDIVGELFAAGIINPKGKFIREGGGIKTDEYDMKRYILAFAEESADGKEVAITEGDIDNFIRAKGAIFSGIRTILASLGYGTENIDEIIIAGGIGGSLNVERAISIGMLPAVPSEKCRYIGNSSLSGALAMALSRKAAARVAEIASGMTYLELSSHPGYMDEFVAACFIPHTDASLFSHKAHIEPTVRGTKG